MIQTMADEPVSLIPASCSGVAGGASPDLPLFAFGDTLDAQFLGWLLERPVEPESARLEGYRAVHLPDSEWQILVPEDSSSVSGCLYRGLTAEDLYRLDANQGVQEGLSQRLVGTVRIRGDAIAAPERAMVYVPTDRFLSRSFGR